MICFATIPWHILMEKHIGNFLYIMKNMAYLEYLDVYTVGESGDFYLLFPENLETDYGLIVSEESVLRPPMQ